MLSPAVVRIYGTPDRVRQVYESNARTLEEIASHDPEGAAYTARRAILDFRRLWIDEEAKVSRVERNGG